MSRLRVVIDATTDARLAHDLAAGGAFVTGYDLAMADECELIVRNSDAEIRLDARVVYVDPGRGAGLELVGFCSAIREQLAMLIGGPDLSSAATARLPRVPTQPLAQRAASRSSSPPVSRAGTASTPPLGSSPLIVRVNTPTGVPVVTTPAPSGPPTTGRTPTTMRTPTGGTPIVSRTPTAGTPILSRTPTAGPPILSRTPTPGSRAASGDDGSTREAVSAASIAAARRGAGVVRATGSNPDIAMSSSPQIAIGTDPVESSTIGKIRLNRIDDGAEPVAAETPTDTDDAPRDEVDDDDSEVARTLHARLRGLNFAEQIKLAGAGDLHERVLLERLYGKNVWEPLLRNPRLTPPEVARIARMGALPRVMIEIIVGNAVWLQVPDVRRALLSNPRLGADQVTKILRIMPKPELRLVPTQTALPFAVRDVARRILRGES